VEGLAQRAPGAPDDTPSLLRARLRLRPARGRGAVLGRLGEHGPTLKVWDRVLINELAYDLERPQRRDIVLFESPDGGRDPLIKRVVALPGDSVELQETGSS
jgi:hypothetical protein